MEIRRRMMIEVERVMKVLLMRMKVKVMVMKALEVAD